MKAFDGVKVRSDFSGDWILLRDAERVLVEAVARIGEHADDCVVLWRWRSNDGTRCNCGYRDIVGGNDGEPE